MKRLIFLGILAFNLCGCVTAQELAAADDTKCRSYGIAPGSPPYIQCRMQLDHDRSERQVASNLAGHGGVLAPIIANANR